MLVVSQSHSCPKLLKSPGVRLECHWSATGATLGRWDQVLCGAWEGGQHLERKAGDGSEAAEEAFYSGSGISQRGARRLRAVKSL